MHLPATSLSLLSPNICIRASKSQPTMTELWLDDRFPPGAEILSSSSRPDLLWYPLAIPPGIQRSGREADHSNTNGAELSAVMTSLPHTPSWHSVK